MEKMGAPSGPVGALTEHLGLFGDTYWGKFRFEENPGITMDIIQRRNEFAKAFDIVRLVVCISEEMLSELRKGLNERERDHSEFYRLGSGCTMILISPYEEDAIDGDRMRALGWNAVEGGTVYAEGTKSYYKIL